MSSRTSSGANRPNKAGPNSRYQRGRYEQLREARERMMLERSARRCKSQPFAHHRKHTRDDLAIIPRARQSAAPL